MRGDKSGSRQKEEREQKEALQEELLSEAFNACMEEQLSFIPPEREIARMHTFSEEFKSKMEKLCRTNGKLKRQEMTCLLYTSLDEGLTTESEVFRRKTADAAEPQMDSGV